MNRIKTLLAGVALATCFAAAPAKAAVHIYDLGVIGIGSYTFSGNTGNGSFTEYVKFQLSTPGASSVSYSNTSVNGGAIIGGNLELDSCSSNCTGTVLAPTGIFVNGAPLINLGPTVQVAGFGPDPLVAGGYFLKLTGSVPTNFPEILYTGTITVAAAIPEATTWAMMLVGFAGLAFASSRRRSPNAAIA